MRFLFVEGRGGLEREEFPILLPTRPKNGESMTCSLEHQQRTPPLPTSRPSGCRDSGEEDSEPQPPARRRVLLPTKDDDEDDNNSADEDSLPDHSPEQPKMVQQCETEKRKPTKMETPVDNKCSILFAPPRVT